jgi:hypothetical protein
MRDGTERTGRSPTPPVRMPGSVRVHDVTRLAGLSLVLSFAVMNLPQFLREAVITDSLYPALLVEEFRAGPAMARALTFPRVPSFAPDLLVAGMVDLLTGSWRLGFWAYGFVAVLLLVLLGGRAAADSFACGLRNATLALTVVLTAALLAGVLHHVAACPTTPSIGLALPPSKGACPFNLSLMLFVPVWQSGAFIAGLAVLLLMWRGAAAPGPSRLLLLLAVTALGVCSNEIVVFHAVLPGTIASTEAVVRRRLAARPVVLTAGAAAAGTAVGVVLAEWAGTAPLPVPRFSAASSNFPLVLAHLREQPAVIAMLVAALPLGALGLRAVASGRAPGGEGGAALRFFLVASGAAGAASLLMVVALYEAHDGGIATWRYANPLLWWPMIFASGLLARLLGPRRLDRAFAVAWIAAACLAMGTAVARRSFVPEIMRWRTDQAACLDAVDPERRLRAGLGAFWQARPTAAASGWRRQIGEVDGDGRLSDEMSHPRTYVQLRHAAPGTMPPYRFILMLDLLPDDLRAAYGDPERVVPCHLSPIWIYPEDGGLAARVRDRARAMPHFDRGFGMLPEVRSGSGGQP